MVRWFADFLAKPLSKVFANSLTTAVVPTDWRLAIICPIQKGDPEDVPNYRPVSLTSIICKIFERILKRTLLSSRSDTRSTSPHQHGFLPRRSSLSNLLVFEEAVTRTVDEGTQLMSSAKCNYLIIRRDVPLRWVWHPHTRIQIC